jgi:eukaryotic-like serine/threonine-protein kinase
MAESQTQQPRVGKETFLERVLASGLVSPERLKKALAPAPQTERGRVIARFLVETGLLTRFQAELLLAGRTDGFVMGQYRILDELGQGGMGRVFKAEHMTMGRVVALKILSTNLTKTERARQLFEREVKAAARLNHPNIVTAFDANQVGERFFLVMEFVDGPNLHDMVKDHGQLPVTQGCDYIRQAAMGLQYAHDLGMVHRDIKPANLLVQKDKINPATGSSIVKILDFGLARLCTPEDGSPGDDSITTNAQSVMGTPDFLSPEQARNLHATDSRSDLYSLGCSLYYLLTGKPPFPGGTTLEKLVRHSTEPPPPIASLRNEIPQEVAAIVHRLLEKKPDDRFQSASELAAALSPCTTGTENTNWVEVDPLPGENVLPVSSRSLPRLAHDGDDPWANIDEDSSHLSTLSDEAATTVGPRPRRRRKSGGHGIWYALTFAILLAVGAAAFVAIRHFVLKQG